MINTFDRSQTDAIGRIHGEILTIKCSQNRLLVLMMNGALMRHPRSGVFTNRPFANAKTARAHRCSARSKPVRPSRHRNESAAQTVPDKGTQSDYYRILRHRALRHVCSNAHMEQRQALTWTLLSTASGPARNTSIPVTACSGASVSGPTGSGRPGTASGSCDRW